MSRIHPIDKVNLFQNSNKTLFKSNSDPNYSNRNDDRQEETWEPFQKRQPNIFRIRSNKQKNNSLDLMKKWLAKHAFWYEHLPNRIFDQCFYISNGRKIRFDDQFTSHYFDRDQTSVRQLSDKDFNLFLRDFNNFEKSSTTAIFWSLHSYTICPFLIQIFNSYFVFK